METSIQRAERLEVLSKTKQDLRLTQRQLVKNEKIPPLGNLSVDFCLPLQWAIPFNIRTPPIEDKG